MTFQNKSITETMPAGLESFIGLVYSINFIRTTETLSFNSFSLQNPKPCFSSMKPNQFTNETNLFQFMGFCTSKNKLNLYSISKILSMRFLSNFLSEVFQRTKKPEQKIESWSCLKRTSLLEQSFTLNLFGRLSSISKTFEKLFGFENDF